MSSKQKVITQLNVDFLSKIFWPMAFFSKTEQIGWWLYDQGHLNSSGDSYISMYSFFFFLIWVLLPFQKYFNYLELIVHQKWAKPEYQEKNHLTFCKQNLSFSLVTWMRLEFSAVRDLMIKRSCIITWPQRPASSQCLPKWR